MGLRCIKIYLNDEIPEEAAILDAWDNCPEKRRSSLARTWLLGAPKPIAKPIHKPANIVPFEQPEKPEAGDPLEKAANNFVNAFG